MGRSSAGAKLFFGLFSCAALGFELNGDVYNGTTTLRLVYDQWSQSDWPVFGGVRGPTPMIRPEVVECCHVETAQQQH